METRCKATHPEYLLRCDRVSGHVGSHQYRDDGRGLSWNDSGTTFHPPLTAAQLIRMGQNMAAEFPSVIAYRERRERIATHLLGTMAASYHMNGGIMDGDELADDAVHLATKLIARLDKLEG